MKPGRLHSASVMLICLLLISSAMGQSTRPVSAVDQASESQSLRITESDVRAATAHTSPVSPTASGSSDLSRITISLIVVICLILLLRSVYRRLTTGGIAGGGLKLVTVLSRSMISPKQQVLVLQVGKRLLVVGDSGGHMNSLCEISDPDEVASMIGQTRSASATGRTAATFGSLFRRANEPFSEPEALQPSAEEMHSDINPDDGVSAEEVGGLLEKVRMLQHQFNEPKNVIEQQNPV